MRMLPRIFVLALGLGALGAPARGQSLLERSPNLSGGWSGPAGQLHFHLLHRFNQSGEPERKVLNTPTFLLALGLPGRTLVGVNYATNSLVAPRYPNEWEFFGRYAPLARAAGSPVDVGVQAGYNLAASSVDGELSLGRSVGRVGLLAAARALGNGYHAGEARFALAGGAAVRLGRHVALAGDVASLLDRADDEELAWSAGLQLALPFTPHTLSLHAANTNTGTLQGASVGGRTVRYGFEFTIPVTLRRYLGGPEKPVAIMERALPTPAQAPGDTLRATVKNLAFAPARIEVAAGTTVVWKNDDPLPHTVTADDESWDSGLIEPGASWSRTFDKPGTYPFHCTPHPFMKGEVVVR